jgi:protein-L-isoaspartate(D-aspartate) O-methyltransferase
MLSPLSFTAEFRRKMAELPKPERQGWLESLAEQLRVYATSPVPARSRHSLEEELREVARGCRVDLVAGVEEQLGPFDPLHLKALLEVPRERFVRPLDLARSAEDTPLPLDDLGLATVSAPHAYLLSYRLLALQPGDSLLELGSGSGYGAALGEYIVGPEGWIVSVEIDEQLAALAASLLAPYKNVTVLEGDAMRLDQAKNGAKKICVTFAVERMPKAWLDAIPEGGRMVAPVGPRDRDQRLVRFVRQNGEIRTSEHGAVRYVKNRSPVR